MEWDMEWNMEISNLAKDIIREFRAKWTQLNFRRCGDSCHVDKVKILCSYFTGC